MPKREKGQRVGAIISATKEEVKLLGYGIYEGDEIPGPDAVGMMADMLREAKCGNPKIKLDNGDIVYGCECWWGSEEGVKAEVTKYEAIGAKVSIVRIADARKGDSDA